MKDERYGFSSPFFRFMAHCDFVVMLNQTKSRLQDGPKLCHFAFLNSVCQRTRIKALETASLYQVTVVAFVEGVVG